MNEYHACIEGLYQHSLSFQWNYLNYGNHYVSQMSFQTILRLLGQPTFKIV
jgi:hypothetical protein